ncbi:hypothetical protein J2S21_000741 [Peribacillus cavernae]|nr:hypothetical protein [Peribacillus cavernae]
MTKALFYLINEKTALDKAVFFSSVIIAVP